LALNAIHFNQYRTAVYIDWNRDSQEEDTGLDKFERRGELKEGFQFLVA
jgi:hypothetical protein